jgi:hypothetical protein
MIFVIRLRLIGSALIATTLLAGCGHTAEGTPVTVIDGTGYLLSGHPTGLISVEHQRRRTGPYILPEETVNFVMGEVPWFDGQSWHDEGIPGCLNAKGHSVEIGVVEARPYKTAVGGARLVWLSCVPLTGK